jgi:hypothetical protein
MRHDYDHASSTVTFFTFCKDLYFIFCSFGLPQKNQKVKKKRSFHPQNPTRGAPFFRANAPLNRFKKEKALQKEINPLFPLILSPF